VGDNDIGDDKNEGKSLVILIAMAMQQHGAGRISRWSTSRASLEATGCRHQASACSVLPRWSPWSTKFVETTQNTNKTQLLASNYSTF
jgi:hypothetical protein